jgi:hypothetical protein
VVTGGVLCDVRGADGVGVSAGEVGVVVSVWPVAGVLGVTVRVGVVGPVVTERLGHGRGVRNRVTTGATGRYCTNDSA